MMGRGRVLFEAGFPEELGVEHVVTMPEKSRGGFQIGSRQAEHLAHVTHRGTDAITNDVRNHCGMAAPVLFVDVLDDFFTTIVLDVEIDVRGFGALDAQEAFEQQVHAHGIDRRDAQTKTHRAVGGATTALTQNVLLTAVLDDLVHRQEVASVVELADDLKLAFDLCVNVGRHLALVTCARALQGELSQPTLLGSPGGKMLFRVSITKVIEAERALFGNVERATKTCGVVGKEVLDLANRFEVVLCVCADRMAGL